MGRRTATASGPLAASLTPSIQGPEFVVRHFRLPTLGILAVAGPEREAFLQGQLTQDVTRLGRESALLAGWCDPRGRLRWAGPVCTLATTDAVLDGGSLGLVVPTAMATDLARDLARYLFRTKATVSVAGLHVTGLAGDDADAVTAPGSVNLPWPGDPGRRLLVGPGDDADAGADDSAAWALADVVAGIPAVLPGAAGEFVPQMVNLDLLDGISFTKGCYTGQEIVARTRYLGRVKRRMLRFAAPGPAPAPGAAVHDGQGVAGQVVRAAPAGDNCELLAVMVLDRLPGPFFLDADRTRPLEGRPLPYAVPELAG